MMRLEQLLDEMPGVAISKDVGVFFLFFECRFIVLVLFSTAYIFMLLKA